MDWLYLEFFYRHSIAEMLYWGLQLTAFWFLCSLITRHRPRLWNRVNSFALVLVVFFILWWTVLIRSSGGGGEISLIPFYSFVKARESSEVYRSIAANILLFIPFGLSLPFVIASFRLRLRSAIASPVKITILSAAVFSFLIEFWQYAAKLGLCETDDVIFNTLGAAAGTMAFVGAKINEEQT